MLRSLYFKEKYFVFIILLFFVFCRDTKAEDFGIHGNTFDIQEENLLEYIQTKLKEIDIDKWQKDFREQSIKSANRPTPTILSYAKTYKSYYFDPSIILQVDYRDNRGIRFAKKGTKINPLDQISLSKNLIFIDGDSKQHIDFAINYNKKHNNKTKIILVNGPIIDLMNEKNIRLYFDQQGLLINKFRIQNIPAIVSQENNLLKIEEVVLNYD